MDPAATQPLTPSPANSGPAQSPVAQCPIRPWAFHLFIVFVVGCLVYLPGLGYSGLSMSEGHRAIPGWEMLADAQVGNPHWSLTTMFEQPYLRKPPGMPWLVAASSMIFGTTEFAARLPAALATILAACAACVFAAHWFGASTSEQHRPAKTIREGGRSGLVAGLLTIFMPLLWYPGRAAEIEAPHNTAVLLACLCILHLAFAPDAPVREPNQSPLRRGARSFAIHALLCTSISAMLFLKGPAGLPVLAGTFVAAILAKRAGWNTLAKVLRPAVIVPIVLGIGLFGFWLIVISARVATLTTEPVIEPPTQFLWNASRIGGILLLPFMAFGAAAPAPLITILPLFKPIWQRIRKHANPLPIWHNWPPMGRVVAIALLASILCFMLVGVANVRYTMPATMLAPLAAAAAMVAIARSQPNTSPEVTTGNTGRAGADYSWLHAIVNRAAWVWLIVFAIGAGIRITQEELRRDQRTSGKRDGLALGSLIADRSRESKDPTELWASELIDTRPEVLWYARAQARSQGTDLRIRWMPLAPRGIRTPADAEALTPICPPRGYLALRTDIRERQPWEPIEMPIYQRAGFFTDHPTPVFTGSAHNFTFGVYVIEATRK